jgi:hypothetical protein
MSQSLETNSVQMNEMLFLHVFVNYIFKQLFPRDTNQFFFVAIFVTCTYNLSYTVYKLWCRL